MSEMVERVAWAIYKAAGVIPMDDAVAAAEAALEQLREPTDQMARGAQATGMGLVTPEARKAMFRAMIDAALSSEPEKDL
jgi:hypothetical protein